MTKEYQALTALLARSAGGWEPPIPEAADWNRLGTLARKHGVEALLWGALRPEDPAPAALRQKLEGAWEKAVFQDTQFSYLRRELSARLERLQVEHVFLKGSSLKKDYPIPELRTMSDLDILVHPEDFDRIRQAAQELDGILLEGDGNHRNYLFPGNTKVEFHPNLIHHASVVAAGINPGWQYVEKSEGWQKQLSPEGFYLHTLCHLADHFANGGVGVRFVLDVWICRHRRQPQPDRKFVEEELERIGLLAFARKIEALAEHWFSGTEAPEDAQELTEYIMTSGSHGRPDRAMLNAVCLSPGGSGMSALIKKAFYPRQELEDRFPWARGKLWLLPAAWTARAWTAVTRRGGMILKWTKGTMGYSEETISRQRDKLERFGVQGKKKKG